MLALAGVLEELEGVLKGEVFGSVLNLNTLNINLTSGVMIPGVAVASSRATPLAGEHWSCFMFRLLSVCMRSARHFCTKSPCTVNFTMVLHGIHS